VSLNPDSQHASKTAMTSPSSGVGADVLHSSTIVEVYLAFQRCLRGLHGRASRGNNDTLIGDPGNGSRHSEDGRQFISACSLQLAAKGASKRLLSGFNASSDLQLRDEHPLECVQALRACLHQVAGWRWSCCRGNVARLCPALRHQRAWWGSSSSNELNTNCNDVRDLEPPASE
jgi:hypothetical protein